MLKRLGMYARANHLGLLALFFALGGTSIAASQVLLPKNSVGTKQLRKNAVISSKVRNNSIVGADVLESTFAKVPSAARADSATAASTATSATTAASAANANALGGTPAASFETAPQATSRFGTPFATFGVATAGAAEEKLVTVPGLGEIYLQCASTGNIAVYYKNTTGAGNRIWVADDGAHGPGIANGDSAFLSNGDKWTAQGFEPVENTPVGTVTNATSQTTTWLISGNTLNRWANVEVGITRVGNGCPWMVKGHVVG